MIADWPEIALPPMESIAIPRSPLSRTIPRSTIRRWSRRSRATASTSARSAPGRPMASGSNGCARRVLPRSETERIRAPIGLDIGAVTPAEIAVSVLGEITGDRACGWRRLREIRTGRRRRCGRRLHSRHSSSATNSCSKRVSVIARKWPRCGGAGLPRWWSRNSRLVTWRRRCRLRWLRRSRETTCAWSGLSRDAATCSPNAPVS